MDVGPPAGTWETYNGYTLKGSLQQLSTATDSSISGWACRSSIQPLWEFGLAQSCIGLVQATTAIGIL